MASAPAPTPDPTLPASIGWGARDALALAVLLMGVAVIYGRTASFGFVDFDDQGYLYQNAHVIAGLSLSNLRWAATATVLGNYHPLTEVVQLAISTASGMRPGAFHAVNAALHAANAGLLFLFLRLTTGRYWPAVLASGLWAWHPLRVESVAWASELKDVLCGTGSLLTLLAYARYAARRSVGRYAIVGVLFILALLAKPMAATLPGVLLLLDYWPLGGDKPTGPRRWWAERRAEKVPLVLVALADVGYAWHAQTGSGAAGSFAVFPAPARAANAVVSVGNYLRQTVWPTGLAAFYPHPALTGHPPSFLTVMASAGLVIAVTAVAAASRRRMPCLTVGWLWFLGMLVPVIGLVQLGSQARADRYTYLPSIGLTVAVVWAAAGVQRWGRTPGSIGVALALAALATSAVNVGYWRDTESLFAHARAVVPDNYEAMALLANVYRTRGDVGRALPLAARAAAIVGDHGSTPHVVYGLTLLATGRDADVRPALVELIRAARIRRVDAPAWFGMGQALARQADAYAALGKVDESNRRLKDALDAFRHALSLRPDDPETADRLATVLAQHGRQPEAIQMWRALLDKYPSNPIAHGDLAAALQRDGNLADAADHYRLAVANGDRRPQTEAGLAWLVAVDASASPAELAAVAPLARQACDDPTTGRQPLPWYAYAVVLGRLDRFDDATVAGQAALARARAAGQTHLIEDIKRGVAAFQRGQVVLPNDPAPTQPQLARPPALPATPPDR